VVVVVELYYLRGNGGEERKWKTMEHHQNEYAMAAGVEGVGGLVVEEVVEVDGRQSISSIFYQIDIQS